VVVDHAEDVGADPSVVPVIQALEGVVVPGANGLDQIVVGAV
jgi:hypothetical protein